MAPSQFEVNYGYSDAVIASDQTWLYKLLCRQAAQRMDMTTCFLPKAGHASERERQSALAWEFVDRTLNNAQESCLVFNSSVNAYRRPDPHLEAPNQIKVSAINHGAMVGIPLGSQKSARVEVRSIAPDANPYS